MGLPPRNRPMEASYMFCSRFAICSFAQLRTALEPDVGEIVLVGLLGKAAASPMRRYPKRPPTPHLPTANRPPVDPDGKRYRDLAVLTNSRALCDESDPAHHTVIRNVSIGPFTRPRLRSH